MRRFFLPQPLSDQMIIEGNDARHIGRVLRMTPGDTLAVAGADGRVAMARISELSENQVFLQIVELIEDHTEPRTKVWLAQGLAKGEKMDFIVQKAVELGVTGVIPLATDHAVIRWDENKRAERVKRWQKIAQEAAKQCGRSRIPQILPVMSLADCLAERLQLAQEIRTVMLYEGETPQSFRQVLSETAAFTPLLLLIGPEGGFSGGEVELCRRQQVAAVTLGSRILRTETAALAALTIAMYHCGELGD
ncbi:MAG TPA: 16S rRNA (uracil(1498)-N(3))-methyltransferase [Patescibacteria group bacterium]|nr:16S rRNA (uracil(1498)-N(3))-methyltransferase [Patescibacteria group bacterium]